MATVNVEKNTYTVEPLYQWDINQGLVIYGLSLASIPEVHFTNTAMGKAIVRQATMDAAGVVRADVPNSLLQKPYAIQAYVCTYDGDTFETQYKVEIPVKPRSKPEDYTLEDDLEVYSFNALENQVVNALSKCEVAEADFKAAEALAKEAQTAYENAESIVNDKVADVLENSVDIAAELIREEALVKSVAISLPAASWVEGVTICTQAVAIDGGTANTLVALQPTDEQMLALLDDGVTFLKVDNDNGTFTAKAGNAAPTADMTIQATLTEVTV